MAAGATVVIQVADGNDRQINNGKIAPDRQQILPGVVDHPLAGQMLRIDLVRVQNKIGSVHMSDQTNARTLSRRQFGIMVAAGAASTALVGQEVQPQNASSARLAPGSFRQPLVPDTLAFDGPLEFTRRDVAPRVHPFP